MPDEVQAVEGIWNLFAGDTMSSEVLDPSSLSPSLPILGCSWTTPEKMKKIFSENLIWALTKTKAYERKPLLFSLNPNDFQIEFFNVKLGVLWLEMQTNQPLTRVFLTQPNKIMFLYKRKKLKNLGFWGEKFSKLRGGWPATITTFPLLLYSNKSNNPTI